MEVEDLIQLLSGFFTIILIQQSVKIGVKTTRYKDRQIGFLKAQLIISDYLIEIIAAVF